MVFTTFTALMLNSLFTTWFDYVRACYQSISTNVVCLKESLQVVILKTSLVTFRFLIVVSTEIAWAAILLKTLFSTVSLALLVSLHYSQISGCPPVSDFWKKLEFCHNRLTPQPWLRKYIIVYFAF